MQGREIRISSRGRRDYLPCIGARHIVILHIYMLKFINELILKMKLMTAVMLLNVKKDKTLMIYNSQFILFAQRFDLINDEPFQVNEFVHE